MLKASQSRLAGGKAELASPPESGVRRATVRFPRAPSK